MWLLLALLFVLSGCGTISTKEVEKVPVVAREETEEEVVLLRDCEAPVWNEVFAVVTWGNQSYTVNWGTATEGAWLEESSSFPGFDRPMLMFGHVGKEKEFQVQTAWGEYQYQVVERGDGWYESSEKNVVNEKGEKKINWGKSSEILFVLDRETKELCYAKKVGGTKIVEEVE